MKKISVSLILLANLLVTGCTKSDSGDDDTIGNWVRRSDFEGVARSEGIACVLGEKAYIGLGYDGKNPLSDFWEYDSNADFWKKRASFPGAPRSSAVAFSANGKIYAGLGVAGVNYFKDFWEYDPGADSWKQIADFGGSARYDAIAFGLNNKGFVCGGYDDNYLKDFWSYDPVNNSWTQLVSPGGSKRTEASVFTVGEKAYLCLGSNNGAYVNELWEYDAVADSWSEKRKLSNISDDSYDDDYTIVRANAVAFSMNGKGYLSTGTTGGLTSSTWEYDPQTDAWIEKTAFEGTAREGATAFSINNRGYITTGRTSSLRLDDLREFLPAAEYEEND